jgi:hypothetical protein
MALMRLPGLTLFVLGLCGSVATAAEDPRKSAETVTKKPSIFSSLSTYERMHVGRVIQAARLRVAKEPAGKTVAFVKVHRYPVFVRFEGLPLVLNTVHALTREKVVRREILVKPGDPYDRTRASETMRNLRGLGLFNLVAAVPVVDESGQLGLLVVTRDLWSLRLESRFQTTNDTIDQLQLQLTERNLFGRGKQVAASFALEPITFRTGLSYLDPRIQGERLAFLIRGLTQFTREKAQYEGYDTGVYLYRPFYDLHQRWGFNSSFFRTDKVGRRTPGGQQEFWDDDETVEIERLPVIWRRKSMGGNLSARWQTGKDAIVRMTGGMGASESRFRPTDPVGLSGLDDEVVERFLAQKIPEDQTLVYPVLSLSFFQNTFHVFRNLAHFGFSEDVQVGPSGHFSIIVPRRDFGSTEDQIILGGNLAFRMAWLKSGLFEFAAAMSARHRQFRERFTDLKRLLRLRIASPTHKYGRLITRVDWLTQHDLTSLSAVSLGGDNGLRGYSSEHFFSYDASRLRGNVEYRSPPRKWAGSRVGFVVFYDMGWLYDGQVFEATETELVELAAMPVAQAVGAGIRWVFPQASRFTYRIDVGVPVDGSGFMVTLTTQSGQAVPMIPEEDGIHAAEFSLGGLGNQP